MGHALPPWDGVAMCLRRTKDLEVLLRILELLRVTTVLTNGGLTTARRINSSGCVGCRSLSTPWASLNWPCLSHRARVTHKRQHNGSENTFRMQCPQMLGAQDTRFTMDHIDKKPNMQAP